ncbi:hypothetical protein HYY69_05550 [Candidatus Woesearchaeota archaeon]|nr:hypothetical protein [Candidatus Woesearchaeota archaeon]
MKFASDDIIEDINQILPKQEIINLDDDEQLVPKNGEFSSLNNNNNNNNNNTNSNKMISSSFNIEYDQWVAASQQATTTSSYSNQILYTEQGIVAWICKCCEYLRMKVGDGYSALLKQPFREG